MKKLIGYPKMFEEAKQSGRKAHIWIVEILIFALVFLIANTAESIPVSIASVATYVTQNLGQLMEILETEGFFAYYAAAMEGLMNYISSNAWIEIISLFSTVAATVIAVLYCVKIEKRSMASMGFRRRNFFLEYLGGAAVGIITISLAAVIGILTGAYSFSFAEPKAWWLLLFLLGFILQGMSEEVLCRGYLMVSMSRKTPLVVCAVLTSVLFALMHFSNPGFGLLPFINLTLSGLSFAFYIIKRGNIWGACAMHTFWNFYQGPVFGISVSGTGCTEYSVFSSFTAENMDLWTGGAFGIEGGLCVTIVEVLTLLFVLFLLPRSKEEQFVPAAVEGPAPSEGASYGAGVVEAAVSAGVVTEAAAESVSAPAFEPVSASEPVSVTVSGPVPESVSESACEPASGSVCEPVSGSVSGPATDSVEVPDASPAAEPGVASNVTVLDFNAPRPEAEAVSAPAAQTPVWETPVWEVPAGETKVEEAPAAVTKAEEAPAAVTKAEEAPATETETEETPVAEAPTAEAPAAEEPRKE